MSCDRALTAMERGKPWRCKLNLGWMRLGYKRAGQRFAPRPFQLVNRMVRFAKGRPSSSTARRDTSLKPNAR